MYRQYQDFLSQLQNTAKYRKLPESCHRNTSLNFSSNDYLQLSRHPEVINAIQNALFKYGAGATGSRLLSGNYPLIEEFEAQIAKDKHTQKALIFASGYQANQSVLSSLLNKKILKHEALLFFDKYNHASLYQAAYVSQNSIQRYHHLDVNHLEHLLQKQKHHQGLKFVVSETVFGMDGDVAPIQDLINLCKQYDCFLYLDEAHATGLFGHKNYGLSTHFDLSAIPHLIMGSFSKALGSHGAYIACDETISALLINSCPGFIYSTANSPLTIASAYAAWKLLPTLDQDIKRIFKFSTYLQSQLKLRNFLSTASVTHIVTLILKDENKTLDFQKKLQQQGIIASALRPPTVPPATSRLRFAINSSHTLENIDYLLEVISQC